MTALRIGLTGGIGSGKSTVSRLFEQRGVPVYDADVISRELVEPGQPALTEIVEQFGAAMLTHDGRLDRAALRALIFSNGEAREQLQTILHPRIRTELQRCAAQCTAPYCLLVIPLLLESRLESSVDRILVVDVDEQTQLQRASTRDGVSTDQIAEIMRSQITRQQRLAAADDLIHNVGDQDALASQVAELHRQYLRLASQNLARQSQEPL